MRKKYLIFVWACAFLNVLTVNAQKYTFDDVGNIQLKNMAPIYQNDIVMGYFAFYFLDKSSKKNMGNYKLILLDENLNKIAEKQLEEDIDMEILMASYNGKHLMMVFHHYSRTKSTALFAQYEIWFRQYDMNLNLLSTENRSTDDMGTYSFKNLTPELPHVSPKFVAVEDKGFVFYNYNYYDTQFTGRTTQQFFPSDDTKTWQIKSDKYDKRHLIYSEMCHNDKIVLNRLSQYTSDYSKYLQGVNLESGEILFDKEMTIDEYNIQIIYAYPDSMGNFVVVGKYYPKDKSTFEAKNLGIMMGKINTKGDFLSHKFLSWKTDFASKIAVDATGNIKGKGDIFIHEAVHTNDGKICLIGEIHDIKIGIISSDVLRLNDFVLIELTADAVISDVRLFEKEARSSKFTAKIPLGGYELYPNIVLLQGGFDYQFLRRDKDNNAYTFFYEKQIKKSKKKYTRQLGTISKRVGDTKYETDLISLDSDATDFQIMPAKYGHLLIVEYFKKTKKLDMRLEKFNH